MDFKVPQLGICKIKSPLQLSKVQGDNIYDYIRDDERILYDTRLESYMQWIKDGTLPLSFEKAGPKEYLFFNPSKIKAAIITCGGLCPGLNNVIRSLTYTLHYRYHVPEIIGFRYGYAGLNPEYNYPKVHLTPELVKNIHLMGGSFLGSSRGNQDTGIMVDTLVHEGINILFCIGGDGTLKGVQALYEEINKRKLHVSVCGIPKTIDNDINFIEKSFGYETAFTIAHDIIRSAHNEATGAFNGIALIKLMGRDSGFIAAAAALSIQEVNFVLIPEMTFDLHGEKGFLEVLKNRLLHRQHALVVVSEGAGQFFFENMNMKHDASGNVKYEDIGLFLKDNIQSYFKMLHFPISMKYIDPSYIIRSAPANANDSKFCNQLGQNAVHAAMAGKTGFVVGYWNNQFTLLPIPPTVQQRKRIDLESGFWYNVLEATGQPVSLKN